MKRDMDLVRAILQQVEDRDPDSDCVEVVIDGRSSAETAGHLRIMADADFIDGGKYTGIPGCLRLKWAGHEFLGKTKNERIWTKAKALAIKTTGALTLTALDSALSVVVKAAVVGEG